MNTCSRGRGKGEKGREKEREGGEREGERGRKREERWMERERETHLGDVCRSLLCLLPPFSSFHSRHSATDFPPSHGKT